MQLELNLHTPKILVDYEPKERLTLHRGSGICIQRN